MEKIDLSLTPYLVPIIEEIGNYKVHWIGVIGPTQSGKSVVLQVAVADQILQDPGPGIYTLPDETTGRKHLDEKIISMINASPELAKLKTSRIRDLSYEKVTLQNMTIYPAWAGSIQTMNSFPMKRGYLDEVRLMGLTIGNESNAVKIVGDRLTTYFDYGIGQGYMVSSPSTEGDLLHQQLSIPGTLYLSWQVPCPDCGEFQELDFFENIKYKDGKVLCRCKYCETGVFSDADRKRETNSRGMYAVVKYENEQRVPSKITKEGVREIPFEIGVGHNRVFFHWSSLDSPFRSVKAIWNEYLQTKDKIHDYKNFWQCWLARFWIEDKSRTSVITLESKKKGYRKGQVPSWTKILTAGVDTQDKGFYVVIRAFGANGSTALVDHFLIPCSITLSTSPQITKLFNDLIFNRVFDSRWKVSIGAIDTGGHRTKELYAACSSIRRLIICKGASENQNVTIQYNKDIGLYLVRTIEYLDETDERATKPEWWLPEDVSKDYLSQFVNRRKTEKQNKTTGEIKITLKKVGQDDYRYAEVHAFICLDIPTDKWGNLRQKLDVDEFISNPMAEEIALTKKIIEQPVYEEEATDYGIENLNW